MAMKSNLNIFLRSDGEKSLCGIAGYFIRAGYKKSLRAIEIMHSLQAYRGPDDYGYALFDTARAMSKGVFGYDTEGNPAVGPCVHNLALANRRLKILDLSQNAHQPMFSEDKTVCIVFNGEIFNYIELKKDLMERGERFFSASDTEVLMKAYMVYGLDFLSKLNGMWAFALYDMKKNIVVLSRDRFGVKPLYYYIDEKIFAFASEIKSLVNFAEIPKDINHYKVINYVTKGYRFVDNDYCSFFENIRALPPSTFMIFDFAAKSMESKKYWSLPIENDRHYMDLKLYSDPIQRGGIFEQFREILVSAVDIRLRTDVGYAFCLSGGMDSSSIVSIASKVLNKKITTFSACYPNETETSYDETEYIDEIVRDTGCVNHRILLNLENFFETVERMVARHDEPVATVTYLSHWYIMDKVKNSGFIVLLNGNGADESVAGYYDYYMYNLYDLENAGQIDVFNQESYAWQKNHTKKIDQYKNFAASPYSRSYFHPFETEYRDIFKSEYYYSYFKPFIETTVSGNMLINRMYNDLMKEELQASLRCDDRNSMAFSLEARSPFLDYRIFEFANLLPNRFKINEGIGKHILRESMKGILCEKVRTRKDKIGFNAPLVSWLRNELREPARSFFDNPGLHLYDYLKKNEVKKKLEEHISGKANHMMFLWNIINTECWLGYVKGLGSCEKILEN
jgi:asparagine synthase (glutamine-hydrolysing)